MKRATMLLLAAVCCSSIVLMCVCLAFQPVMVSGYSMTPTLDNQELVFTTRHSDHIRLSRGDIVVARLFPHSGVLVVKRIVGLPGDTVWISTGTVWVNGRRLTELYVLPARVGVGSMATVHVPRGRYFLLGDNRVISHDSREWGCVEQSAIVSKVVFACRLSTLLRGRARPVGM